MKSKFAFKVLPVSFDSKWCDPAENIKRIKAVIEEHPSPRNTLFVFPELTLHGFVLDHPGKHAISSNSVFHKQLSELARKYQCNLVVGGIERNVENDQKPFNTIWCWNTNGKVIARYRKNHLFTLGTPSEKDLYSPGKEPVIVDWDGTKVGLAICFDIRFAEFFEHYKGKVDYVVLPACWVDGPDKENQLKQLSRDRAIQTGATFVTSNRSGSDQNFTYSGSHYVFDKKGSEIK